MRRRVWQGFLDWFRPVEHEASTSPRGIHSADISGETCAEAAFVDELGDRELLEFLATDLDPVTADPLFKEELREQLWELVQEGATARSKDH